MIKYKDMTFCVNKNCKNRYSVYLTEGIQKQAEECEVPAIVSEMIC